MNGESLFKAHSPSFLRRALPAAAGALLLLLPAACPAAHPAAADSRDGALCDAALAGLAPEFGGPSRRETLERWLLGDVCAALAPAALVSCDAPGGAPGRRHTSFSNGGEVWANRGAGGGVWTVAGGRRLPPDGFYASVRGREAGIVLLAAGRRAAFSRTPDAVFVDARPAPGAPGRMLAFGALATDGAFLLEHGRNGILRRMFGFYRGWTLTPPPGGRPFRADIGLEAHGAKGARVRAVEMTGPRAPAAKDPEWFQAGDCLSLDCDGLSSAYRILFE